MSLSARSLTGLRNVSVRRISTTVSAAVAAARPALQKTHAVTAVQRPSLRPFSTTLPKMSASAGEDNSQREADKVLQDIADYVHNYEIKSEEALKTSRLILLDSVGCALEALRFPAATKVLGPVVPGADLKDGSRVIGTPYQLDPIRATFNNGALIRWLDYNDTWLAQEWGHPSDNLGTTLSLHDYYSRQNIKNGKKPLTIRDVLNTTIKAHEIQGVIAIKNSLNAVGMCHVFLVKIASAATASKTIGNSRDQTIDVLSHAFCEPTLRAYRHAPNAMSRKSWAAGDAGSRAVHLAYLVQRGEKGMPSVVTTKRWGFNDVFFKGKELEFDRPYKSYVMENVLFKLVPAEFHSQTACEAGAKIHKQMKEAGKSYKDIEKIEIKTQRAAIDIICKNVKQPCTSPADADHDLGYLTACPLVFGNLDAKYFDDDFRAAHPEVQEVRSKITYTEDPHYTEDYYVADSRSIGNGVKVTLKDGSTFEDASLYPIGHRKRRDESIPAIKAKFEHHIEPHFDATKKAKMMELFDNAEKLDNMPVNEFMDLFAKESV